MAKDIGELFGRFDTFEKNVDNSIKSLTENCRKDMKGVCDKIEAQGKKVEVIDARSKAHTRLFIGIPTVLVAIATIISLFLNWSH